VADPAIEVVPGDQLDDEIETRAARMASVPMVGYVSSRCGGAMMVHGRNGATLPAGKPARVICACAGMALPAGNG
jgi:hypothetical protein